MLISNDKMAGKSKHLSLYKITIIIYYSKRLYSWQKQYCFQSRHFRTFCSVSAIKYLWCTASKQV